MQDAADNTPIVNALLAANVGRQMRLNARPLLVGKPKQVLPHVDPPDRRK
jgi:hypothetical protein